ncbi:hypothetical protein E4T56_gene653 [Termitomyces sp. T112]|nr:hypothetical protein E4T56_gene653 [Termitomyces sp. T112]
MSYLQNITFNHYTALLQFDPNNPVLSNWLAFTQEFSSKFGIFDTVAEAEENLFNLRMCDNERFTTFIIWFKQKAYETSWNYNALQFALRCTLPQQIKDVLHLAPKQTTYHSENTAPWTPWNASGNTNWQAGATNGIWSSIPANPTNPMPCFPSGQGITSTNPPPEQHPLAQLNAADLHETPEPLDTNPNDHDSISDPTNDQEALCANRIQDSLLTLRLNWDNPTDSRLVPFDVSPSSKNSEATINHSWTPLQLRSRSAWSLIINVQLNNPSKVFPTLVDSSASGTFVSNQLSFQCNNLNRPLKLQLFDGSPTTTRITQYHNNTLTLDNDLQFQAWLLVTQLPLLTPIKDLTMQFPGPKASLAATIPLHLQSIPDSNVSHPSTSTSGATQSPSTSDDNSDKEGDATLPWSPTNSATTLDSSTTTLTSNSINSRSLDIKIISTVPFAHLLQDSTPTFQLQITPALPEEHLHTGTTVLESKMEEQILSEVVPPEYHKFADVFSQGSAKELPLHHFYNHKIDLEEGTSPLFVKIYNMSEVKLQALKEYLNNMLSKGFICPLISAAGAPVLFAKKKDRSL